MLRIADDRLASPIEGGVQENRNSCSFVEAPEEPIKCGVILITYGLKSGASIHVDDRGNQTLFVLLGVKCYQHKGRAGILRDVEKA